MFILSPIKTRLLLTITARGRMHKTNRPGYYAFFNNKGLST